MILASIARLLTIISLSVIGTAPLCAQSMSAKAILYRAVNAMGGMAALRAVKNQVVESEGKQFDSSSMATCVRPKPASRHGKSIAKGNRDSDLP